jgi:hypothetical protein
MLFSVAMFWELATVGARQVLIGRRADSCKCVWRDGLE